MLALLVCRVTGLRRDSCRSSLTAAGGPRRRLTQVGMGSGGDGGGVLLTCVYRIDI